VDITIAIDAMGGDHGTRVTVPAAVAYLKKNLDDTVVLVGLPDAIEAELSKLGFTDRSRLRIHATTEIVAWTNLRSPPCAAKKTLPCEFPSIWSRTAKLRLVSAPVIPVP